VWAQKSEEKREVRAPGVNGILNPIYTFIHSSDAQMESVGRRSTRVRCGLERVEEPIEGIRRVICIAIGCAPASVAAEEFLWSHQTLR
jgi:hypothetical protein